MQSSVFDDNMSILLQLDMAVPWIIQYHLLHSFSYQQGTIYEKYRECEDKLTCKWPLDEGK